MFIAWFRNFDGVLMKDFTFKSTKTRITEIGGAVVQLYGRYLVRSLFVRKPKKEQNCPVLPIKVSHFCRSEISLNYRLLLLVSTDMDTTGSGKR